MSRQGLKLAMAVLTSAFALGAVAPASLGASPYPNGDTFYAPPANLASYPPGTVLRTRTVTLQGPMQADMSAAYQLLYRTTNATGEPVATVATLMLPSSPAAGPRKLVSYQTFYDSLTLNCAPSNTMQGNNNGGGTQHAESGLIAQELQQGWDVVVPDYEGPQSEWAVGPMLGQATLDGVRAVENFAPADLEGAKTPVGMNGYSGGAIASMWAEALAPIYAHELNIVAVAVGGLFPDLDYTMSILDGSQWYGVEIGVLVAIDRAYPQLNLQSFLNPAGKTLAAQDGQDAGGCAGAALNEPGGNASQFTTYPSSKALAADPRIKKVLNNLYMETAAPVPTAPSFYYNATGDELGRIQPVDKVVAYYCAHGATIDYDRDPIGGSHLGGVTVYWPMALQYLQSRFAGTPPANTCAPGSKAPGPSSSPGPTHPPGCPAPSGRLSGTRLGLVRLGMTRTRARHVYRNSSDRGRRYEDFFCLDPIGLRVGYASPRLLRTLAPDAQRQFVNRVIWISTANPYYAVRGVRPGSSLAVARKRLRFERPFHIGLNYWYVAPDGSSTAILKVRHGVVEEIGLAARELTRGRTAQTAFLTSFS